MSETKELTKQDPRDIESLKESTILTPVVDIYESQDEIRLHADLPGVDKQDISIHFEKQTLTLEGQRKLEDYERGQSQLERITYRRAFSVPEGIDAEKIQAKLEDGVLQLQLPKAAKLKPRQISVTAG